MILHTRVSRSSASIIGHVCAACGLRCRGANFLVVCQELFWYLSHYMLMQQSRSRQAGTQRQQLEDIFGIPTGIWKHKMHSQMGLITIIRILYGPLLFQLLLLIFNNIMGDYMKRFFYLLNVWLQKQQQSNVRNAVQPSFLDKCGLFWVFCRWNPLRLFWTLNLCFTSPVSRFKTFPHKVCCLH